MTHLGDLVGSLLLRRQIPQKLPDLLLELPLPRLAFQLSFRQVQQSSLELLVELIRLLCQELLLLLLVGEGEGRGLAHLVELLLLLGRLRRRVGVSKSAPHIHV